MSRFARRLPKAELHLHIEGTLEPELLFELARRNKVKLRFPSVESLRAAYRFTDLQSFLDIYYEGAKVLLSEEDFFDLARAYFDRAKEDGVRRAELFFDPQTHTERGVPLAAVIEGLTRARVDAEKRHGLSSGLILCFLRHLPAESAMKTLEEALPHKDKILGVGLDSAERDNPPGKFQAVFARARAEGFRGVAHAGEEGPPEYIREALDILQVERIDHGVRCLEDAELTARLRERRIPLTVCPLSNLKLRVVERLEDHCLPKLLAEGLRVSLHSDDPAYFGGYVADNYAAVEHSLGLDEATMRLLARNSFESAFLPEAEKRRFLAEVDACPGPAKA